MSRAGAQVARNLSSAMADHKAENAVREASTALAELEVRWNAAKEYLKIDQSRERHAALSVEAEDPNLWNDQDHAREVTTELGRLNNDLGAFDALRAALDDGEVLADFSREALSSGDDLSILDELTATVSKLEQAISALETQSLFSGPYDQNDAIVELHAGAGGTDAQDWTEMLMRMYSRFHLVTISQFLMNSPQLFRNWNKQSALLKLRVSSVARTIRTTQLSNFTLVLVAPMPRTGLRC